MEIKTTYIIKVAADDAMDIRLKYCTLSIKGQTVKVIENSGLNHLYVTAGVSVDCSADDGVNNLYLDGAFTDYTTSAEPGWVALKRGSYTYKIGSNEGRKFIFVNGYVDACEVAIRGASAILMNRTEAELFWPAVAMTSEGVSLTPAGVITTAPVIGKLTFSGMEGEEQVFIKTGQSTDCSWLQSRTDLIWFSGKWSEYTKTVVGNTINFQRSIDIKGDGISIEQECVIFGGIANIINDQLVFSDGYIDSKEAFANRTVIGLQAAGGKEVAAAKEGHIQDLCKWGRH